MRAQWGMSGRLWLRIGICLALLPAAPALANGWTINDTVSALDGSRTYAATLTSSNTIHTQAGSDEQATLVVRCRYNRVESYIAWPQPLGSGALDMRWKTDNGNFITEVWSVSLDGSATFSERTAAFLTRLESAHHVTFQLSLPNFDMLLADFNVTGADAVVKGAVAACHG